MTSWMKERDRLVEQMQAFVQDVAAAHPVLLATPAPAPEPAAPTPPSVPAAKAAAEPGEATIPTIAAPLPAAPSAAAIQVPRAAEAARPAPMRTLPSIASERAAIVARVAAFKAHQEKLNREREAYYATVQAKIKDVLGNEF